MLDVSICQALVSDFARVAVRLWWLSLCVLTTAETGAPQAQLVAGVRGQLALAVAVDADLERAGRVSIRPGGDAMTDQQAVCGGLNSSYMADAVQPPCAG